MELPKILKRNWQMKGGVPVYADQPLTLSSFEKEFGDNLDEWEDQVFKDAVKFRLHRFKEGGAIDRAEVQDFEQALALAGVELRTPGHRVLIYAVTEPGRFVCLERKRWAHFLDLWNKKKEGTSK